MEPTILSDLSVAIRTSSASDGRRVGYRITDIESGPICRLDEKWSVRKASVWAASVGPMSRKIRSGSGGNRGSDRSWDSNRFEVSDPEPNPFQKWSIANKFDYAT